MTMIWPRWDLTANWWKAQYAIPLLGMILGNTMNGVSLGLNTLTGGYSLSDEDHVSDCHQLCSRLFNNCHLGFQAPLRQP